MTENMPLWLWEAFDEEDLIDKATKIGFVACTERNGLRWEGNIMIQKKKK